MIRRIPQYLSFVALPSREKLCACFWHTHQTLYIANSFDFLIHLSVNLKNKEISMDEYGYLSAVQEQRSYGILPMQELRLQFLNKISLLPFFPKRVVSHSVQSQQNDDPMKKVLYLKAVLVNSICRPQSICFYPTFPRLRLAAP